MFKRWVFCINIWGRVFCELKDQVENVMDEGGIGQVCLRGVQGSEEASLDQIESLLKLIYYALLQVTANRATGRIHNGFSF